MVDILQYTFNDKLPSEQVLHLYDACGWVNYTQNPETLMQALENSLCVIAAWDGDRLVGLVRAVGDACTILYIQDILVLPAYRRRGIGSHLIRMLLDRYHHVRQKVLLTDDATDVRAFYESLGFHSCDKGGLVAFARFDV